jgi:hypothetical protein
METGLAFLIMEVEGLKQDIESWDQSLREPSFIGLYLNDMCNLAKDVRAVRDALSELRGSVKAGVRPSNDVPLHIFQQALVLSTVLADAQVKASVTQDQVRT